MFLQPSLGLTLDELLAIYRVQFPVMRQYESDTWYDRNGRIVFTASKGLPGGPRKRTITYVAPFDRCDRESDYCQAWQVFTERFKFNGSK